MSNKSSVALEVFTNPCIIDRMVGFTDAKSLLYLSRTCKDVWMLLRQWPSVWERVLSNHEDDLVPFAGAHLRTPHGLIILHFTLECLVCGGETNNQILGDLAIRLCDEHLAYISPYAQWQNGPNMAQAFASAATQHIPTNITYYSTSQPPLGEWGAVSHEATATTEFYSDTYLNPTFLSAADIDARYGFPMDEDEDLFEEEQEFQGTQPFSDDLANHYGPSWLPHY